MFFVLQVIKHGNPERESTSPVPLGNVESTMERLIEKMMVDLDAESDEDSCFTVTIKVDSFVV